MPRKRRGVEYAEYFTTMAAAKVRWAVLEQRQAAHPECESIIVTALISRHAYVLAIAIDPPEGFFDGATGTVRWDMPPSVFARLWQRHVELNILRRPPHTVITRHEDEGIPL